MVGHRIYLLKMTILVGLYLYLYIYIYVSICIYIYIYVYVYSYVSKERGGHERDAIVTVGLQQPKNFLSMKHMVIIIITPNTRSTGNKSIRQ